MTITVEALNNLTTNVKLLITSFLDNNPIKSTLKYI